MRRSKTLYYIAMGEEMLGPERFEKLARLAKLRVSQEQAQKLRPQLEAILGYIGRLQALEETPAPSRGNAPPLPLREDEPAAGLSPEAALAASPSSASGYFRVPKFVKGGKQ
jgi:aspartyl-tRNA(Asn)/glutamyl-tRNA(Gln) amidotransferase subunit C